MQRASITPLRLWRCIHAALTRFREPTVLLSPSVAATSIERHPRTIDPPSFQQKMCFRDRANSPGGPWMIRFAIRDRVLYGE